MKRAQLTTILRKLRVVLSDPERKGQRVRPQEMLQRPAAGWQSDPV